jgi:hypothetical protein
MNEERDSNSPKLTVDHLLTTKGILVGNGLSHHIVPSSHLGRPKPPDKELAS